MMRAHCNDDNDNDDGAAGDADGRRVRAPEAPGCARWDDWRAEAGRGASPRTMCYTAPSSSSPSSSYPPPPSRRSSPIFVPRSTPIPIAPGGDAVEPDRKERGDGSAGTAQPRPPPPDDARVDRERSGGGGGSSPSTSKAKHVPRKSQRSRGSERRRGGGGDNDDEAGPDRPEPRAPDSAAVPAPKRCREGAAPDEAAAAAPASKRRREEAPPDTDDGSEGGEGEGEGEVEPEEGGSKGSGRRQRRRSSSSTASSRKLTKRRKHYVVHDYHDHSGDAGPDASAVAAFRCGGGPSCACGPVCERDRREGGLEAAAGSGHSPGMGGDGGSGGYGIEIDGAALAGDEATVVVTGAGDKSRKKKKRSSSGGKKKKGGGAGAVRGARGGVSTPFPLKMHLLLDEVEENGETGVVSWMPHGRSFLVHRPHDFVGRIMPRYFKQTKLTSFQRQLNLYGFNRLTAGPDKGGYYHELFLRGKPFLSSKMTRIRVKGTGCKGAANPADEPDFYLMPAVRPDRGDGEYKAMLRRAQESEEGMELVRSVPPPLPTPTHPDAAAVAAAPPPDAAGEAASPPDASAIAAVPPPGAAIDAASPPDAAVAPASPADAVVAPASPPSGQSKSEPGSEPGRRRRRGSRSARRRRKRAAGDDDAPDSDDPRPPPEPTAGGGGGGGAVRAAGSSASPPPPASPYSPPLPMGGAAESFSPLPLRGPPARLLCSLPSEALLALPLSSAMTRTVSAPVAPPVAGTPRRAARSYSLASAGANVVTPVSAPRWQRPRPPPPMRAYRAGRAVPCGEAGYLYPPRPPFWEPDTTMTTPRPDPRDGGCEPPPPAGAAKERGRVSPPRPWGKEGPAKGEPPGSSKSGAERMGHVPYERSGATADEGAARGERPGSSCSRRVSVQSEGSSASTIDNSLPAAFAAAIAAVPSDAMGTFPSSSSDGVSPEKKPGNATATWDEWAPAIAGKTPAPGAKQPMGSKWRRIADSLSEPDAPAAASEPGGEQFEDADEDSASPPEPNGPGRERRSGARGECECECESEPPPPTRAPSDERPAAPEDAGGDIDDAADREDDDENDDGAEADVDVVVEFEGHTFHYLDSYNRPSRYIPRGKSLSALRRSRLSAAAKPPQSDRRRSESVVPNGRSAARKRDGFAPAAPTETSSPADRRRSGDSRGSPSSSKRRRGSGVGSASGVADDGGARTAAAAGQSTPRPQLTGDKASAPTSNTGRDDVAGGGAMNVVESLTDDDVLSLFRGGGDEGLDEDRVLESLGLSLGPSDEALLDLPAAEDDARLGAMLEEMIC